MRPILLLALLASPALAEAPLRDDLGARTFDSACASCHYRGADRTPFGTRGAPADSSPDDLVLTILFGKAPEEDEPGMPGFAALTDADVARLAVWLHGTVKPDAPWADVPARVAALRASGQRED